jgi:hypothetical protein
MAAPTPTTYERQVGHYGFSIWSGLWTGTGEFTATALVDVSGLGGGYSNGVKLLQMRMQTTSGISALLEFDATANQFIAKSSIGNVDDIHIDFRDNTDHGLVKTAAGSTGDIVLTTLSAASADEVTIYLWWYAN